jgi:hypothetical protein
LNRHGLGFEIGIAIAPVNNEQPVALLVFKTISLGKKIELYAFLTIPNMRNHFFDGLFLFYRRSATNSSDMKA